jgi:hypothetical protein
MSEKWIDWHQEPEPGETWDFRRYESDPDIDALAEQMGVLPEDVTPETILGYVEEIRAAGVALPAAPGARSYAQDYAADGVRPPSPAAAKIDAYQDWIRSGKDAEAALARRTGQEQQDAYADNLRQIVSRGEEAQDALANHEEGLYASLALNLGLPPEPTSKREHAQDELTDEERAFRRYENENLGLES